MLNQKKIASFVFVTILIILLISPYLEGEHYDMTSRKLENSIKKYIEKNLFFNFHPNFGMSEFMDTYYLNCMELMNKKYGHSIKGLSINNKIQDEHINLYFVSEDPLNIFKYYKGNCTYTGYKNVIICDTNFIKENLLNISKFRQPDISKEKFNKIIDKSNISEEEFNKIIDKSDISEEEFNKIANQLVVSYVENLIIWIVGHEIGHIAHRHQGKYFNFDGKGWRYKNTRAIGNYDAREKQADEFAVEALGNWQLGHFLWMGLNQLAANPQFFGAEIDEKGNIILSKTSTTHLPLFLRILNMAIMGIERGLIIDSTGYYENLRDKVLVK
ncbi:hypothetical protein [Mastigocoleus sp. MO_188.B34]|uniref:hypothetical protein n=1 Tax=Mastigocoleus sp. MO_188.B34 TaxID=3036635 RepID=UPI0026201C22|nr:hypothetical protein [Mastigocoleus sp. MO_188.B34]MDJ0698162.1 hypothetical protein [Mastigocoleus sp. MO_188.B34]